MLLSATAKSSQARTSIARGPEAPGDTELRRKAAELNRRYRHHSATEVVRAALTQVGKTALVSSFGAESVVLLHLVSLQDRAAPVIFIDTEMLFTETLVYQQELTEKLGLNNLQIIRAHDIHSADPEDTLHKTNPDACCSLRKAAPLNAALANFDGWITGRKRFQSGNRAALEFFEIEDRTKRIKVNPLAHWAPEDVQAYMDENRLPRHPLVARGYPSIGCAPCTSPAKPDEDPRAGRWRTLEKEECGIHLVNGRMVRIGATI
ncbi:MAG: phosphoadenylyl-sulfate reductase [Paracoccaceae bacterium]